MLANTVAFFLLASAPSLAQQDHSQAEALLRAANDALASNQELRVRGLFQDEKHADYLLDMASRGRGLSELQVVVIPSPPGWDSSGEYWAHFFRDQDIEEDHDTIYPLVQTDDGLKLGEEIPEWETGGNSVRLVTATVDLDPANRKATIGTEIDIKRGLRAPVFRLGHKYRIIDTTISATDAFIPTPTPGSLVRAGGLLIPWGLTTKLDVAYERTFEPNEKDKVTDEVAYLSMWWIPSLDRNSSPTQINIHGPEDWVLRSEGTAFRTTKMGGAKVVSYKCNLPISYPKVIAGAYKIGASKTVGRHTFVSYQLGEIDVVRGRQIVDRLADGMRFFEQNLGPFPFNGYEVFDGQGYYGIESYSHTLLSKPISLRYATHEMGHTYFGGVVPCHYVRDTWNEGVTTYVDDILFLKNVDETLRLGLRTIQYPVPLRKMNVAYAFGGATYWRGAYVMHMLEGEIGQEAVLRGLREMVRDRVGKDTVWADLRAYFEKASGKELNWFWEQWIDRAEFPVLRLADVQPEAIATRVRVEQSGTSKPYRLRFGLRTTKGDVVGETVVVMDQSSQEFRLPPADKVEIVVYPHTLASVVD